MTDALSAIGRVEKNNIWWTKNVEPILELYFNGEIGKVVVLEKLEALLDEAPSYYDYWGFSPYYSLKKIIERIRKYGRFIFVDRFFRKFENFDDYRNEDSFYTFVLNANRKTEKEQLEELEFFVKRYQKLIKNVEQEVKRMKRVLPLLKKELRRIKEEKQDG